MLTSLKKSIQDHIELNAFCIEDQFFTYRQLSQRICAIQRSFSERRIEKPIPIGIVTTNNVDTYASILACWFSGNYYIPLNPKLPVERNMTIVNEAKIKIILTSEEDSPFFSGDNNELSCIRTSALKMTKGDEIINSQSDNDSLLYILFTSGSTGLPKGVPISYGNIKAFIDSYFALDFNCSEKDRFLQMFDLTFDVSVASYLVPLLLGACVYPVPSAGIKYKHVYQILKVHQITFAAIVPSILNYLSQYFDEIRLPELKFCVLTAEASNIRLVNNWGDCMPNGKIINLYGPTEATIWCTGYFFDPQTGKAYNDMLAIGQPFKNVNAIIMDEDRKLLPQGVKGELCISSSQLTTGYINNDERNRTCFFERENERFYATGDLCYIDDEGVIFYCGRIDHQVKIQGFRVELSEIEVVMRKYFDLENVAVAYKNELDVVQICVFIENSIEIDFPVIKNELGKHIPYYMIPSQIRHLAAFPYNTSGKIDRAALLKLIY